MSVFLGDGFEGFTCYKNYSLGSYEPYEIITGDFNSDGYLDVVVPCFHLQPYLYHLTVYLGKGNGEFNPPTNYSLSTYPAAVTSGDFNQDSKLDVVVVEFYGNSTTRLEIFLGNGDGSFSLSGSMILPFLDGTRIVSTDFNNDSFLDLAVMYLTGVSHTHLTVLFGDGTGGFTISQNYMLGPGYYTMGLAPADYDHNGFMDLAIVLNEEYDVIIGYNDGSGTFTFQSYPVGSNVNRPFSCINGDFNNDGYQDLAVSTCYNLSILMNDGTGGFSSPIYYPKGNSWQFNYIVDKDFNRDSILDLIETNPESDTVTVYLGNGDGTFGNRNDIYAGDYAAALVCGNFNPKFYPIIHCKGTLSWSKVIPGTTVTGNFSIENVGDPRSYLNWNITGTPDWGEWTFTPSSGFHQTPSQGPITVTVKVIAPSEWDHGYEGNITISDIDGANDSATLPAILTTKLLANITCDGSLMWTRIKPGATITGTFTVSNTGVSQSQLAWRVTKWPDWGIWTITPNQGENLTPEDEPITVSVSVTVPDISHGHFSGQLTVSNSEVPANNDTIRITLSTPFQPPSPLLALLQHLFVRFPYAFSLLNKLIDILN